MKKTFLTEELNSTEYDGTSEIKIKIKLKIPKMLTNFTEIENLELADIRKSLNAAFLILMGIIVFLMQGGFAFLEAGSVR